jgi:hypothetical protein
MSQDALSLPLPLTDSVIANRLITSRSHQPSKRKEMEQTPHITKDVEGGSHTAKDKVLETGASLTQTFEPIKAICTHLNAFHVYAAHPSRSVEANHYCTHLSADASSAHFELRLMPLGSY